MTTPATPSAPSPSPSFEEQLHTYWKNNRQAVLGAGAVVVVAIVAFYGWQAYQAGQEKSVGREYAMAETTAQLQAFVSGHAGHALAGVAQLRLADEAYAAGRYAEALTGYDKASAALATGPFGARARLGSAMTKLSAGRAAEGEDALKKMAADPAQLEAVRVEATYQLLSLALAAGRNDDVAKYSDQLLQLAPTSPWTQRALAMRASIPASAVTAAPAAAAETTLKLTVPGK